MSPKIAWGPGLHVAAGQRVNVSAYEQYVGRWSRLFVPAVLTAAGVSVGDRVLDVAAGPGEAAGIALDRVGSTGLVVAVDISREMLDAARARLAGARFRGAVMDGQDLAFGNACFDRVVCQLGLMFFPDPVRGLAEFRRVLRPGGCASIGVISTLSAPRSGAFSPTRSATTCPTSERSFTYRSGSRTPRGSSVC